LNIGINIHKIQKMKHKIDHRKIAMLSRAFIASLVLFSATHLLAEENPQLEELAAVVENLKTQISLLQSQDGKENTSQQLAELASQIQQLHTESIKQNQKGIAFVQADFKAQIEGIKKELALHQQWENKTNDLLSKTLGEMDAIIAQSEQQQSQSASKDKTQPQYAIPMSARPLATKGYGFWFIGEALLWQATEDNLYSALIHGEAPNETNPNRLDFDWDWGFRIGTGYNFAHDHWDIALNWTHMENHAHRSQSAPNIQVWLTPGPNSGTEAGLTTFTSARWKVNLEQIDLELGREFFAGTHFTIRPNIGARSAFIFQKFNPFVSGPGTFGLSIGPVSNSVTLKNKFWGFGFLAGLDTNWKLGRGFSLFGDASFALLFGFFKVQEKGTVVQLVPPDGVNAGQGWKSGSSFRTEKPIFDLALGLKWNRTFFEEKCALTLKTGYEYHLYPNQNQWQVIAANNSGNGDSIIPTSGDLGYQGVTFSAQIDF
jgi:TolA-binding protein